MTLLALAVLGSLAASAWLMPSRLERVAVAIEHGDRSLVDHELAGATDQPVDPGEARALVDVALTLGRPERAAAILERFLSAQPGAAPAIRLLIEVQRQRHRMGEVAALDERLYAIDGDPGALRECADIYAARHMVPERIAALRRLAGIGRATASDIGELAHRLADAGDGRSALTIVMMWLAAPTNGVPAEVIGLAAALSAASAEAPAIAAQLGELLGRSGEIGPLHVLIQTYAERGRPALSLIAGRALGEPMSSRPEVALALAQLEALQGEFAAARARLDALERAGTLLPAGLPMLAELSLQTGDLGRAVDIAAAMSPQQIPEGLPHRLVQALDEAGRADLLARLPLEPIASSSPASAAAIALARGDLAQTRALALAALEPGADPADLGPAFGRVVRALGLEHALIARLKLISRDGMLDEDGLSLMLGLAATTPAEASDLLEVLRAQRDLNPRAALVWAVFATRNGGAASVVTWLRAGLQTTGPGLPAQTLIDLLLLAVERNEPDLVRAAAAALAGRTDLPTGWTQSEIALTTHAREKLTLVRLRDGVSQIGAATDDAARNRIAALLVDAPGFAQLAPSFRLTEADPAMTWLADAAASGPADSLELLAAVAPQRALKALAGRVKLGDSRLLPVYVAALIRSGSIPAAMAELGSAARGIAPKQQDAMLYETLARLPPQSTLPVLRIAAATGRTDWLSAYEDRLGRAGMQDELRSVLRADAASEHDATRLQSLASRLVELNDRDGAVGILRASAAGKPPASAEVEQLMFLWGPRAAREAVAWTRDQALAAPLQAVPKWLDHLAYLGDPGTVVSVVERRPSALSASAAAVRAYGAALVGAHARAKAELGGAIAAASSPDVLKALAQLALDTGQNASAWHAASLAASASPSDPQALLLAAEAAAGMRRSEDAARFYTQVLALAPQPVDVCIDAGDALLAAKRLAEGRKVLQAALARLPSEPSTLADARLRARSLMLLSRDDEAARLLTEWLARFPGHPGLRADLLQARLDRRQAAQ